MVHPLGRLEPKLVGDQVVLSHRELGKVTLPTKFEGWEGFQ